MHQRLLTSLALAFVALIVLQSLLGGLLLFQTIGFSATQIIEHYHEKSLHGLLEVILPHTLFIAVALMAVIHFLTFIETISKQTKKIATPILFILFLCDQMSPIFISFGMEFFAYVKIMAFVGFEGALGAVWFIIFRQALKTI